MMSPVFIIGFSRTGSTLLQHIINKYTDIGIVPEMHIYWPGRLHTDFVTTVKKHIGDLNDDDKVDQLIQLMYSKKLVGTFWQIIDRVDLDVADLKERIILSDRSIRSIVDALLKTLAKSYNKNTMGAKFPVHFSYVDKLLEWYPRCKIIHTIRDPRAIFVSQYYKRKDKNSNILKNTIIGVVQFIHVNLSFKGAVRMHKKMKDLNNYYLLKYEKTISQPEQSLKSLCGFLGIEFTSEMLNPKVFFNTSFGSKELSTGFHRSSLDAWKHKLPNTLNWLIKKINGSSMRKIGYA